jgi:hypothetical protein
MEDMLKRRLRDMGNETEDIELRGRLKAFSDVLIPDGCAFKVASALSNVYVGTSQPAELKLHSVFSLRQGGCTSIEATAGSVHDSDGFWPEQWKAEALYLWDLGYVNNERFIDAATAKAHVVQRLKTTSNPVVLASYGKEGHRRAIMDEDGKPLRLQTACELYVHHQPVLDLDVEITDATQRTIVARVVCVPFGEDRYYLTTLPRAIFSPHDIAELYRMRWEIELFFRGWHGAMRMDEVQRLAHPVSLRAAILGSLLAALLAQKTTTFLNELAIAQAASAAFPP